MSAKEFFFGFSDETSKKAHSGRTKPTSRLMNLGPADRMLTLSYFNSEAKHPHLFTSYDIDRHVCHRIIPMEVLSLGMGRTGTASMWVTECTAFLCSRCNTDRMSII